MDTRRIIREVPGSPGSCRSGSFLSRVLRKGLVVIFWVCSGIFAAHAQSTWLATPGSGVWNTAGNWTPATVPTTTAIFDASSTTNITFSANASVGSLEFNAGAPAYSFTLATNSVFGITGAAIVTIRRIYRRLPLTMVGIYSSRIRVQRETPS
jgi:hypothetical protein